MLKKLFSLVLTASVLLSLILLPAGAVQSTEDIRLQYLTECIYDRADVGIAPWISGNRYLKRGVRKQNGEVVLEVTDFITNTKFTCSGGNVRQLTDEMYLDYSSKTGAYALCRNGAALTSYIYSTGSWDGKRFLLTKADGFTDLFDAQGKKIAPPPLKSGWMIYAVLNDQMVLVRKLKGANAEPIFGPFIYNAVKWDGTMLFNYEVTDPLEKLSESAFRYCAVPGSVYDAQGELITSHFNVYYGYYLSPSGKYLVLNLSEDWRIYDDHCKLLATLQVAAAKDTSQFEFTFLKDDTILYKNPDGAYVVSDIHGNELLTCEADEHKLGTVKSESAGKEEIWGLFFRKGEQWTYYNLDMKECYCSEAKADVIPLERVFAVKVEGKPERYYDQNAVFMIEQTESPYYVYKAGVLLQCNGSHYAVCDPKGQRVSDFIYELVAGTGYYGVVCLLQDNGHQFDYSIPTCYDMWTSSGTLLNAEPFHKPVVFREQQSMAVYERNGKFGVLRLLGKEDATFMDAPKDSWYYDAVEYCAENGLFSGTAAGRFSPDNTMTRAMLVTVLWRLDGEQSPSNKAEFTDVTDGNWYTDAVAWASENGIVYGVGKGRFNPDGNVTREQIATILRRYADYKGFDTSKTADLSSFPDVSQISAYAREAMSWANAEGLIVGNQSAGKLILQPTGNATRAQVASILMRYVKNIAQA